MKKFSILALYFCILFGPIVQAQVSLTSADGKLVRITDTDRIITIGGSVTETVFALGFGDKVIATDQSSTFPSRVFSLPRVPYLRALTSEGILALGSSLIISSNDASPLTAIEQIRDSGTPVLLVEEKESIDGVILKLETIGKAFGAEQNADTLIRKNKAQVKMADSLVANINSKPKVLFILAVRGESTFMVGGTKSGAQKMIENAGGVNAFDSFEGYKTVSNESIMLADPDYILVMETRADEIRAGLQKTPGLNSLRSVKDGKIIAMDGNYVLGFGPRYGSALLDLIRYLHPELKIGS